jgi:hypothetical protein
MGSAIMSGIVMVELFATVAAGLWAGIALYIALVEHPCALKVGVRYATEYFRVMSKRTAPLMMLLAAVGGVAGLLAWYETANVWWLIGAVLLLLQFPFTAIFIVPTNIKLLKVDLSESAAEADALHRRWSRMHGIRTLTGVLPFLYFVMLLV